MSESSGQGGGRPPVETTAMVAEKLPAGTHGVELADGKIFVAGEGVFETQDYRKLADWEIQQLTFVFPHLFIDMDEAFEREHKG
jgi:hypothetical protein